MNTMLTAMKNRHNLSDEQWDATETGHNLTVTAGAGSGKTRVLTVRYLRMLMENPDLDPDAIAAITFTEKAAMEMKARIRTYLDIEIQAAANDQVRFRWMKIRDQISDAPISTIHGFCGRLIRDHYFQLSFFDHLGLDPHFGIMNEPEKNKMLRKIADETLKTYWSDSAHHAEGAHLAWLYGADFIGKDSLAETMIQIYKKVQEAGADPTELKFLTHRQLAEGIEGDLVAAAMTMASLIQQMHETFQQEKLEFNKLDFSDLEVMTNRLLRLDHVRKSILKQYRYVFVDEFQDINPLQEEIIRMLTGFGTEPYENRLFVVGDRKQSIYGFRGTDVALFDRVRDEMATGAGRVVKLETCYRSTEVLIKAFNGIFGYLSERHHLDLNEPLKPSEKQELTPVVPLELVVYPKKSGGDPRTPLVSQIITILSKAGPLTELEANMENLEAMDGDNGDRIHEGNVLGDIILRIHREGDVAFKDMAVLLRNRNPLAGYEQAMRAKNIPYTVLGGLGFNQKSEIQDIMHLYRIAYFPDDGLSLIGVLRSPIFAVSDVGLAAAAGILLSPDQIQRKIQQLDQIVFHEPKDHHQIGRALHVIQGLQADAILMGAGEFLRHMVRITRYHEILAIHPEPEQRLRNLEKLMAMADEYDLDGIFPAAEFADYLADKTSEREEGGEALLDTEHSDAVKFLTIHGAKGLEFPTVILPDGGKSLTKGAKAFKQWMVFDPKWGILAIKADEEGKRDAGSNSLYQNWQQLALKREKDEAFRLLYVGFTRAEQRLIVIGEDQAPDEPNTPVKVIKEFWDQGVNGKQLIRVTDYSGEASDPVSHPDMDKEPMTGKAPQAQMGWRWSKPLPLVTSVSQYLRYQTCPRQYFMNRISGGSEGPAQRVNRFEKQPSCRELSAAEKGTLMHRLLEHESEECIKLNDLIIWVGQQYPGKDPENHAAIAEALKRYLHHYRQITTQPRWALGGRRIASHQEIPFRMALPVTEDVVLQGMIDRLDIYETDQGRHGVIIDYKTNQIREAMDVEKLLRDYTPQMLIYRMAATNQFWYEGVRLDNWQTWLLFLDRGDCREVLPDSEESSQCYQQMLEGFAFMANHNQLADYPACQGDHCRYCQFQQGCRK